MKEYKIKVIISDGEEESTIDFITYGENIEEIQNDIESNLFI